MLDDFEVCDLIGYDLSPKMLPHITVPYETQASEFLPPVLCHIREVSGQVFQLGWLKNLLKT